MALVKRWSEKSDAFHRKFSSCQEDWRAKFPYRKWPGGYRWFRAPNVVPIEWYKRQAVEPIAPKKRAG